MKIEKFKVLLYLKKSGMDKNGKAPIMGHADITSTQVYAQVTEQKISNDMDKLIAKRERNRLSNEKTIGK